MCNLSRARARRPLAQSGTPLREKGKIGRPRSPISHEISSPWDVLLFYSTKFTGLEVENPGVFEFRSLRLGSAGLQQHARLVGVCFSKRTFGVRVWLPVRGSRTGYSTSLPRYPMFFFRHRGLLAIFRARWVARRKRCGLQGVAAQLEGSVCSFRSSCSYSRYWFCSRQRGQRSHSLVRNPRKPFASCLMRSQQGS